MSDPLSPSPVEAALKVENVPRKRQGPKPQRTDPFEQAWPNGTRESEIGAVVLDADGWVWQRRVNDIDGWESVRTWYEIGGGNMSVKSWSWLQERYGPLLLLVRRDGTQDEIPLTDFERRNLAYALSHPEVTP